MYPSEAERISYSELKQGMCVWSKEFNCILKYEDCAEWEEIMYFWFQRMDNKKIVLLRTSEIYRLPPLIEELM